MYGFDGGLIKDMSLSKLIFFDLASKPDYSVESLFKKSCDQVVYIKSRAIGKTVPICNLAGESIIKLMIQKENRQLLPGAFISTL